MEPLNVEIKKTIGFTFIYFIGFFILYFWGLDYFEYVLGYGLMFVGFFYILYFLMKNDLKNKHLTSIFFISLLFFWLRIPFVFKHALISPDFNIYYQDALRFLNKQIPLIRMGGGYGPVFYMLFFIPAALTGGDYFAVKFFLVFLDFLNLIMIYFITNQLNIKSNSKLCLLYALLPIGIMEFGWNAHNDSGMIFLVLVSIYFLLKNDKPLFLLLSSCFLIMAVAYKYYAAFILPIYLIYFYKNSISRSELFKKLFWFAGPILVIGGILILFLPWIITSFLASILVHLNRASIYGILNNINFSTYINGMVGFLFAIKSDSVLVDLMIALQAMDLLSVRIISDLSLLIVGVMLIIAFKNKLKNPVYFFPVITPTILFLLKIIFNYEIPLHIQYNINLGLLILVLIIFYFHVLKLNEFKQNELIPSFFYTVMIFLTLYIVVYPWYYMWLIPFIFIFLNKIRQSNYILTSILMIGFVFSTGRFVQINFVELSVILLIITFIANIILFWKLLEYKAQIDHTTFRFSNIAQKFPSILKFDMEELYSDTKKYSKLLFFVLLVSSINVILLNLYFMFLIPNSSYLGFIIRITGLNPMT